MTHNMEILEVIELARAGVISVHSSFLTAGLPELVASCNGCGAAGSWFRPPKRIYGTLIVYACHAHDWGYKIGITMEDKDEEDRRFHNNLLRLIDRDCKKKWYKPRWLMRRRARKYYLVVRECGGPAFWAGKN